MAKKCDISGTGVMICGLISSDFSFMAFFLCCKTVFPSNVIRRRPESSAFKPNGLAELYEKLNYPQYSEQNLTLPEKT